MTAGPGFTGLLYEAWISLGSHRLRTFLAMLGIIIGVGSVVLMMAIGGGSQRAVEEAVNSLGSNILMVTPGVPGMSGRFTRFEVRDAEDIGQLPLVQTAAPASFPRQFPVFVGKFKGDLDVTATTFDYFIVREWDVDEGRLFTGDDVRTGARVVILGATTAEKAFPGENALGRTLTIRGTPFEVIGVLKRKGRGMDNRDQDDAMFVPITTGDSHLWSRQTGLGGIVQIIYVKAVSADALDSATENIRTFLRKRLKLPETANDSFMVHNLSSITAVASDTANAFSTLLGAIASISLLVGGIGIMNIMLVNITERTREIGIRKAIGATQGQILVQFLLEAVIIAFVGCLCGIAIGLGGGLVAEHWLAVPVAFDLSTLVLALGVSTVIGVGSGLYPAYKASRMQPIEALRAVGA